MKKIPASVRGSKRRAGELRPEYRFDYAKAQSNRFAGRAKGKSVVVRLAPDGHDTTSACGSRQRRFRAARGFGKTKAVQSRGHHGSE